MNTEDKQEMRKLQTENKAFKIVLAIMCLVAAIAFALADNYHTQLRMNQYAMKYNCEWHYSYYIDEQPVCK